MGQAVCGTGWVSPTHTSTLPEHKSQEKIGPFQEKKYPAKKGRGGGEGGAAVPAQHRYSPGEGQGP